MPTELTPQRIGAIRRHLLRWYDAHQQPFPWRSANDPWAALVAAVCAQQTQMSRVLPLYARWMERFPTLADAAQASEADALRVWGRGGYPKRALYLQRAAQQCLARYGGAVPESETELLQLPGVGPFTAAIVLAFGFGIDSTAVDTNVIRLLGRLVLGDLQPARESGAAEIQRIAERLTPRGEALRWNPAVMDFGAAVCAPRPRCSECPLTRLCRAQPRFAAGERAEPVRAQAAFAGSQRQLRGMLMRALREGGYQIEQAALTAQIGSESGRPIEQVEAALSALIRDGLAHSDHGRVRLGAGGSWQYAMLPISVVTRRGVPNGKRRSSRSGARGSGIGAQRQAGAD